MHTDSVLCNRAPREFYLTDDASSGLKVEESFIFGFLHDGLDSVDLPLYAEIVDKSSWEHC